MPYIRKEVIGDCTLYQGDANRLTEILEGDNYAVCTDPPYGIGMANGFDGFGGFGKPIARKQYSGDWDNITPTAETFNKILSVSKYAIIFGGNYFTDLLPKGRHWFVWDKKNTMPTFSDCELAWSNIPRKSVKLFTYEYNGLLGKREERVHPTQKPVEVMKWCIRKFPKDHGDILDPYMGSGSTLVACVKLGLRGVGIEMDATHFDSACKRIEDAYRQPDMFIEPPKAPPAIQEGFDL